MNIITLFFYYYYYFFNALFLNFNKCILKQENIGGSSIGGTTYYFSPDENVVPEIEDHTITDHNGHGTASKSLHSSHTSGKQILSSTSSNNTSQHSFYVYAGPPSFLQNPTSGLQRTSFFMNEDLRNDLIQRNSVALSTVDVTLFPGKLI